MLEDTAESELSFGYQFNKRDVDKDKTLTSLAFKDVEAQRPLSRATISDYAFPVCIENLNACNNLKHWFCLIKPFFSAD